MKLTNAQAEVLVAISERYTWVREQISAGGSPLQRFGPRVAIEIRNFEEHGVSRRHDKPFGRSPTPSESVKMTRCIKKLEELGLIEQSGTSDRSTTVRLTETGSKLATELAAA